MTTASTKEAPHLTQLGALRIEKPHPLPGAPLLGGNMNVLQGGEGAPARGRGRSDDDRGRIDEPATKTRPQLNRPVDDRSMSARRQVIARGQLVAVGDEFGVLVTELAKLSKA